jgi:N-acetylneuraminate synthase
MTPDSVTNTTDDRTCVIAEAGVNHNGSLERAHQLVDAAADAGADAVKFQTFKADRLASATAKKAAYQERETGAGQSQLEMLRALELSPDAHVELIQHCADRGIEFLSSPFDEESLALLVKLGVRRLKLGSGELTNAPILIAAGRSGLDVLLSTGMATLAEVEDALGALSFGRLHPSGTPSRAAFAAAWESEAGRDWVQSHITVLHCTTEYPSPVEEANLLAMLTMSERFGVEVGYSDHTVGHSTCLAAVALGATVIEKHVTLDRSLPGPDHKASIEPGDLKLLVDAIRAVEAAMGSGIKAPVPSEIANMAVARKSIVAATTITKGTTLSAEHLAVKRPGTGRSPFELWDVIGTVATRDYAIDETIE